jgi:hypothetical protein
MKKYWHFMLLATIYLFVELFRERPKDQTKLVES